MVIKRVSHGKISFVYDNFDNFNCYQPTYSFLDYAQFDDCYN